MIVRAFPNPSGSAIWRLADPYRYFRKKGIDAQLSASGVTPQVLSEADILVCQSTIGLEAISQILEAQQAGKKIIVDMDDWFDLNADNIYKKIHEVRDAREILEAMVGIADLVTVTTPYLEEKVKQINPNTKVLPNLMDMERWDLKKYSSLASRTRIGWVGSMTHYNDVKMIAPVIRRIHDEFEDVEFVFMGDERIGELFEGLERVEIVSGVPFEVYPTRLHGLRLDIGLAPLEDNEFNRCKSNIKWLEYAITQTPAVLSKVVYGGSADRIDGRKIGVICETEDEWYRAITNLIRIPEYREEVAGHAYAFIKAKYDLESHIDEWIKVYQSVLTQSDKALQS